MTGIAGLSIGALDTIGYVGDNFTLTAIAGGTDFSNPEPLLTTLESLVSDGDDTIIDRFGNREIVIQIRVTAPNSDGLASGEQTLMGELEKPNELAWTPPDGWGATTVHRVWTSYLEWSFNDYDEARDQPSRIFAIRLVCHPAAFSAQPITTVFEPVTASETFTIIDDCTSTTGWTGNGTISTAGGDVITVRAGGDTGELYLLRAGAVDMTGTPYLVLDWKFTGAGDGKYLNVDGAQPDLSGEIPSPDFPGYSRTYWRVTDDFAAFSLTIQSAATQLAIAQVARTNVPPSAGTRRQRLLAADVVGTRRTMGSVVVSADDGLGDAFVCTWRDEGTGYSPTMRGDRTGGADLGTEAGLLSGFFEDITSEPVVTEIPTWRLPRGAYHLLARLRSETAGKHTIFYSQVMVDENGDPVSTLQNNSATVTIDAADTWQIVPITALLLPAEAVRAGSTLAMRIDLQADESGPTVERDESWVVNVERDGRPAGAYTIISAGGYKHLWIDTASVTEPIPLVYVGTQADGTDARFPSGAVSAWMDHELWPGQMKALVACTGSDEFTTTLQYTAAWAHNAPQLEPL